MRLDKLASRIGCTLQGEGSIEIDSVATLDEAGTSDLSFLSNPRYASKVAATRAAAVIVPLAFTGGVRAAVLRAQDPYLALAQALEILHPPCPWPSGIHPHAVVHPTAQLGPEAAVGPYAVVETGARLGKRARLGPHVVIGAGAVIGDDFVAYAHASVRERVQIGNRVTLQNGAVIGADGFGYATRADGTPQKMVQAGTVVLEDDVEIGANATIDRATVGATRIRRRTKIDNLVMVAHGCDVGAGCYLAAQVGLAGSTKLGAGVQLGGQAGVAGHLEIGDFARVAAQSGVPNDVPAGRTVGGYPAVDIATWRRLSAAVRHLPELVRRLRRIERSLGLRPHQKSS